MDKDRLRKLCEEATPGPWVVCFPSIEPEVWTADEMDQIATPTWTKDAKFIAEAKEAVPLLLDENESLRAERDALQAELNNANEFIARAGARDLFAKHEAECLRIWQRCAEIAVHGKSGTPITPLSSRAGIKAAILSEMERWKEGK